MSHSISTTFDYPTSINGSEVTLTVEIALVLDIDRTHGDTYCIREKCVIVWAHNANVLKHLEDHEPELMEDIGRLVDMEISCAIDRMWASLP